MRTIAADLGRSGVRIAVGLAACIAVLMILGAIHATTTPIVPFYIDGEFDLGRPLPEAVNFPALLSGSFLFGASGLAFFAAAHSQRFPWLALGAFFAFMGVDELVGIHEELGILASVDWEIVYMPVLLGAGITWLSALRQMWQFDSERILWLGGAAAWLFALAIEAKSHSFGVWHGQIEVGLEESFEMIGSSMFLLALFLVRRRASRPLS